MANQPQPWDRLPKESEEAYRAFLRYRDLGESRNVLDAYRGQDGGKAGASQVSGRWNKWLKAFDWHDRTREWDNHLQAERQIGIDRAARDEAEEWEKRRQAQAREDYELARIFLKQARTLAMFPVTEQSKTETRDNGRTVNTTTVRPISPRDLKDAASIAKDATALAWAAIHQAIPPDDDDDDFDPETATPEECRAYLARTGRRRKARARSS